MVKINISPIRKNLFYLCFALPMMMLLLGCTTAETTEGATPKKSRQEARVPYVKAQLLITFEENVPEKVAKDRLLAKGAKIIRYIEAQHLFHVQLPVDATVEEALPIYQKVSGVRYVEANYLRRTYR